MKTGIFLPENFFMRGIFLNIDIENGYDCGMFLMAFADAITRNAKFLFQTRDMENFRGQVGRALLEFRPEEFNGLIPAQDVMVDHDDIFHDAADPFFVFTSLNNVETLNEDGGTVASDEDEEDIDQEEDNEFDGNDAEREDKPNEPADQQKKSSRRLPTRVGNVPDISKFEPIPTSQWRFGTTSSRRSRSLRSSIVVKNTTSNQLIEYSDTAGAAKKLVHIRFRRMSQCA